MGPIWSGVGLEARFASANQYRRTNGSINRGYEKQYEGQYYRNEYSRTPVRSTTTCRVCSGVRLVGLPGD
jgi:hypothetical protein